MKKITIGILTLLFISIILYTYRDFNKYKVLKVIDASYIYIDLNTNSQIDDSELIRVYGIKTFKDSKNKEIDSKYNFYLDYFAKNWAEKKLLNKLVIIKKHKDNSYEIYQGKENYAKKLLKEGYALSSINEYKKLDNINLIKKKIKDADAKEYVILNNKTNKYHKINCKYGMNSYDFVLISRKNLPKDSRECHYCYQYKHKKKYTYIKNIKKTYDHKNFENINVYFVDFLNSNRPIDACTTAACKDLLNEINKSRYSIDFAIYGINKQSVIFNALINAQNRGVKVRWVTDFDSESDNYYPNTLLLMKKLKNYNTDNPYNNYSISKRDKNAIMHNKFFIFDNRKVWTGSANVTDTDFSNFNANYAALINSEEIAKIYDNEFEQMYNGKFHNEKTKRNKDIINLNKNTRITALFSPEDKIITSQILPLIDSSKQYIYMPIFYLTHKELANHLITAHKRGVDVKIITDATNAHGKYSIHKILRAAGIKVKTENKAGKMHMKSIIIDDKYSVIGSMNFTKSGETHNDENVLIIENSELTKYIKSTFLLMWKYIPEKYLAKDPRAEAPESIGSCTDGIDNDFDGLIDSQDSSCSFKKRRKN